MDDIVNYIRDKELEPILPLMAEFCMLVRANIKNAVSADNATAILRNISGETEQTLLGYLSSMSEILSKRFGLNIKLKFKPESTTKLTMSYFSEIVSEDLVRLSTMSTNILGIFKSDNKARVKEEAIKVINSLKFNYLEIDTEKVKLLHPSNIELTIEVNPTLLAIKDVNIQAYVISILNKITDFFALLQSITTNFIPEIELAKDLLRYKNLDLERVRITLQDKLGIKADTPTIMVKGLFNYLINYSVPKVKRLNNIDEISSALLIKLVDPSTYYRTLDLIVKLKDKYRLSLVSEYWYRLGEAILLLVILYGIMFIILTLIGGVVATAVSLFVYLMVNAIFTYMFFLTLVGLWFTVGTVTMIGFDKVFKKGEIRKLKNKLTQIKRALITDYRKGIIDSQSLVRDIDNLLSIVNIAVDVNKVMKENFKTDDPTEILKDLENNELYYIEAKLRTVSK